MRKVLFFFGQLTDEDVRWLGQVGRRVAIAAGQAVVREAEPSEGIFLVLDGSFAVQTRAAGGREIARLGRGEVVGEMSFVDSRPPSATVVARIPSTVIAVPAVAIAERLEAHLDFTARFYKAIAVYLSQALRRTDIVLGAELRAGRAAVRLDVETEDEMDEIDPAVLSRVQLAGERFERLCRAVQ